MKLSLTSRIAIGVSALGLVLAAGAVLANETSKPAIKLYMSPASTVPSAGIVKNLMYKCPNVKVTLDSKKSDYMLEARGWPEHYRFTVFRKGGDAVFATTTVLLSNAVKDVCKYVNTYRPPANPAPAKNAVPEPKPPKSATSDHASQ